MCKRIFNFLKVSVVGFEWAENRLLIQFESDKFEWPENYAQIRLNLRQVMNEYCVRGFHTSGGDMDLLMSLLNEYGEIDISLSTKSVHVPRG